MGSSVTTFNKTTTNSNKCIRVLSTIRAKRNLGPKNYALWGGGSATIVSPTEESNGDIILAALQAEKDEMAFLLAAHKSSCKLQNNFGNLPVKVEPAMDESQVYVQVVPAPLMDTTNMMDTSTSNITATTSTQVTSPKPKRPASLSIPSISTKNIEGIPIDTPSNAILSFDSMLMETRTGLTPTTILTPLKSSSNLNTPTCGSQQRSIIFTPLFSPNTEASLLTSL